MTTAITPSDSEIVARFIFLNLWRRDGEAWLGQHERLNGLTSYEELLAHIQLHNVAPDAQEGLRFWLRGQYPIVLRENIPTPEESLSLQCLGKRYVSCLTKPEQLQQQHGRHSGALALVLHDLERAHKFFHDPDMHWGQVTFFRKLQLSLDQDIFADLRIDATFTEELSYLMADMNAHPVHMLKYLKAIVLAAHQRRTNQSHVDLTSFWLEVFALWGMRPAAIRESLHLNYPTRETVEVRKVVGEFFSAVPNAI